MRAPSQSRERNTEAKEDENLNSNSEEIPPSMYMKTTDRNLLNRNKNAVLISTDGGAPARISYPKYTECGAGFPIGHDAG
jgi:hypothetical protein